jgi:calcineurin-like phosphoesterase family protein
MKIYAVSDTHFGHEKLITLANRPEDFTERLLKSIRQGSGDLLIHCGDFCIGEDKRWASEYNYASSGFKKKVLVRGNHDKKSDSFYISHGFDLVCDQFVATHFGKRVIYSHMPVFKNDAHWAPSFAPVLNIHGHLHGNSHRGEFIKDGAPYDMAYHYDLAPELHDYRIVNIEHVLCQSKKH